MGELYAFVKGHFRQHGAKKSVMLIARDITLLLCIMYLIALVAIEMVKG